MQTAEACPAQPGVQAYEEGCPSQYTVAVLVALLLYLAAFSPGLGSVPWAVNSELFPPEVRGSCSWVGMHCLDVCTWFYHSNSDCSMLVCKSSAAQRQCCWSSSTLQQVLLQVRGLGNGLAALANWTTNAVVSYTFLPATRQLGASTTFGIYAVLCAAGGAWAAGALPETKGAALAWEALICER